MTLAESVRVFAMLCVLLLLMTHTLSLPLLAALGFIAATGTVALMGSHSQTCTR